MDISRRQQVRAATVDIGARIRAGRGLRGLSQEKLAAALGVTFQQVQKYEKGTNRVSVAALLAIAEELALDIAFFLPAGVTSPSGSDLDAARAEHRAALDAVESAISKLADARDRLWAVGCRIETSTAPALPASEIGSAA